jgi:GNAT superfamily N-acetyltransferase
MELRIRDATLADAATIAEFNSRMAEETEGRPLDPGLIGPGVIAVLNDPARGRYWVAEVDGQLVGQIMVTWEWSDWRNGTMWWIQSVYVAPEFRRRGVFSGLYRQVESHARASADACGLRLYVEKDNSRAVQTYLALGMNLPGYQVMEVDFRKSRQ